VQEQQNASVEKTEEQLLVESFSVVWRIAQTDTSGGRCCGKLILAWYNKKAFGGWDPTDLWVLDYDNQQHFLNVIKLISRIGGNYPGDGSWGGQQGLTNIKRIWGKAK
jgi:hypothetical protein